MAYNTLNSHISPEERDKWNQNIVEVNHIKEGKTVLPLGDGTRPGSSTNDFSNEYKRKLDGIEEGATRYIHPPTHPATMITGLSQVAYTGDYNHILNRPLKMIAEGGNCDTVNGIRVSMGTSFPSDPKVNCEFFINTSNRLPYIFTYSGWQPIHAAWA